MMKKSPSIVVLPEVAVGVVVFFEPVNNIFLQHPAPAGQAVVWSRTGSDGAHDERCVRMMSAHSNRWRD